MTSAVHDIAKIFHNEIQGLLNTYKAFELPVPMPAALEFQYCLNHFFTMYQKDNAEEQCKHLEKACGHLQRSHFDWLKSHILEAQNYLAKTKPHYAAYFGHRQGELRKKELDTLGAPDRTEIFDEYRLLLTEILPHYPLSERKNQTAGQSFSFADLGEQKKVNVVTSQLYEEWARLEAQLAAFSGDRCYDHIMMVLRGYLEDQLDNLLPLLIAILKLSLLNRLNHCYESEEKSKEAALGGAPSSNLCMFTFKGYSSAIVAKWNICQNMIGDLSDPTSGNLSEILKAKNVELDTLKGSINELFEAYSDLATHFKLPTV